MAESRGQKERFERIDLSVTGMSCAACAARIEKGLGTLEGVSALLRLPK